MDQDSERDRVLNDLGYPSIDDYRASDLWAAIRDRAFKHYGPRCRLCDTEATRLFHLGYGRAVLSGKSIKPLVPVCTPCYCRLLFSEAGTDRTIGEAHNAYYKAWTQVRVSKEKDPVTRHTLPGYCQSCGRKVRNLGWLCKGCVAPRPGKRTSVQKKGQRVQARRASTRSFAGYGLRNCHLKELGFGSYQEYLASPLWAGIRRQAYASYGWKCHLCKSPAAVIHHLSYDLGTLKQFDRKFLVALCRQCHEAVEFRDGTKRSYAEALREFLLMEQRAGYKRFKDHEVCKQCELMPLDTRLGVCRDCASLVVDKRKRLKPRCLGCGKTPRKGYDYCRPCEAARGQA